MTGAAAHATTPTAEVAAALAAQLREQLGEDLAVCTGRPATAPAGYLNGSLVLAEQLTATRYPPRRCENREDREHEQNRRYYAVVSQLLRAAADTVQGARPSRAAWEAAERFLGAAGATLDELLGDQRQPAGPRLRLITGGRP